MVVGHRRADDRDEVRRPGRGHQHLDRFERPAGVLHVEHGELGPGRGRQPADPGGGELQAHHPHRHPAGAERPLDVVVLHRSSGGVRWREPRVRQGVAVDDVLRDPPRRHVEQAAGGRPPVQPEALVRPADRVRGQDHVVEAEQRVVGGDRLRVEHVQPGPGDPVFPQGGGEGGLVDDRPAGDVHQVRGRLHQRDPLGVEQVPGLGGQGAADADVVRLAEQVLQRDEPHPGRGGRRRVGPRVGRDHPQVERPGQPGQLPADVPEPDDPERPAGEPLAVVVELLGPPAGPGQPVLDEQLVREGEDERHRGRRDRPADPVRGDRQQHPGGGAGGHVDVVVPDPEPGDDLQPARAGERGRGHPRPEQQQPVVVAGGLRRQLPRGGWQVLPTHPVPLEQRKADVTEPRAAVRPQEVSGDADPEHAKPSWPPGAASSAPRRLGPRVHGSRRGSR